MRKSSGSLVWKRGDKVKLIGIPPDARDYEALKTRTLFEKCLGKIFTVQAVETVEGITRPLIRLNVGRVVGKPPYIETIWVEPEYLKRCD